MTLNITDALFLERSTELRLVSDTTFEGNQLVFSVKAVTVGEAQRILDTLDVNIKVDAQFVDPGIRGIDELIH